MGTRQRIGVVAGLLGAAVTLVLVHLFVLMVGDHETWSRRSQENRWAFRAVPTQRGALLDRTGTPIAWDEPSTDLLLYYSVFRRYHPVGAAVHAATLLSRLREGAGATSYSYLEGPVGPRAALEHLMATPARWLQPGMVSRADAGQLATALTSVFAHGTGWPRKRVYAAMREASRERPAAPFGAVFDMPQQVLAERFEATLRSLRDLDARFLAMHAESPDLGAAESLFAQLERRRRQSLEKERVTWWEGEGAARRQEEGSLLEDIALTVAVNLPFELASALRVGAEFHAGLRVRPAVRRMYLTTADVPLLDLVGRVADYDRTMRQGEQVSLAELPAEWADAVIGPEMEAGEAERDQFKAAAAESYRRAVLGQERRGLRGFERAFDDELRGVLGLRYVERDAARREHRLWGQMRVQSGDDVAVSLDLGMQAIAERAVRRYRDRMRAMHLDPGRGTLVEAAMTWIDARTGDVLADAGTPAPAVEGEPEQARAGLSWRGDGSLGSLVKPFVLLEHLRLQALGETASAGAAMQPCVGHWDFGARRFRCGPHHGAGHDPVAAIAQSCNVFFFQAALGMEEAGLRRAYQRFGLVPDTDGPFAAARQERIAGLAGWYPRPGMDARQGGYAMPMRAVGYGVNALPMDVARAYAALATGALPTLGFRLGEGRPVVPIGDFDAERAVVREGLRQCVASGTAREVRFPAGLDLYGKTGTAEIGKLGENNAWFAGFLGGPGQSGVQLCFCAVVYWVPDGVHGGDVAAQMVADVLAAMQGDPALSARYLVPEGGR